MTWIEVVSDAVKIGLGALIGAIAALVNAKISHSHKKNEEYSRRRRDSLETIMPEFEEVSIKVMQIIIKVPEAFNDTTDENEVDKTIFDCQDRKEEIAKLNLSLVKLESRVVLLGFEMLASKLDEFRKAMKDILNLNISTRKSAIEKLLTIDALKIEITKGFAEAYKIA